MSFQAASASCLLLDEEETRHDLYSPLLRPTTNMAEAKLDKKIQKKVAPRAAFIKVVKNNVED